MNSVKDDAYTSEINFTKEDLEVFRYIQQAATEDLILPFPDYLFENEEDVRKIHAKSEIDAVMDGYVYPR